MRRKKASNSGRTTWILAAAGVGYLIGVWSASAVRNPVPAITQAAAQAPVQAVALRFQQDFNQRAAEIPAGSEPARPAVATAAMVVGNPHFALFEPKPLDPQPPQQTAAQPPSTQLAELTPTAAAAPVAAPAPVWHAPARPIEAAEPRAETRHVAARPHYMLDDSEIASIRRRLHMTPDQERMWPAVAAALRNIGLEREREVRRGEAGAIDPDSQQVQNLKYAALPLLMSFSDEQKDEVRHLARNMGLTQLAEEF